ncbi:hypothetical protein PAXRUDRAFT_225548 [Paxillus rubicundulus Ve08.2h10]|uniref:Uncharacterized protein n=1 Tax=Paxillus rubicundulus Ve08.2h10 TaxID=930991 RepID=A0A0D0DH32_9AGAM|nr:hypothetical protein PAXRUDRAFT_225548 [Paxillus rubicundulus Ve08.2h10]
MQWLKAEALNHPGYNTFRTAQHWNVSSSDRMGIHDVFNKKVIQEALGVRGTQLSEAETGAVLVNKYGLGGTQPNQAVIRMFESGKCIGHKALLSFLKEI